MLRDESSNTRAEKIRFREGARKMLARRSEEDIRDIEQARMERDAMRRGKRPESDADDQGSGESEDDFVIGESVQPNEEEGVEEEKGEEGEEDEIMEEAEESEPEEDDLSMFQEHYEALLSMEFVETKYPHDATMVELGILKDVELILKNMHLAKFLSHRMESYKELTCEFLASMRVHWYAAEDRADLDQGLGWITFLAFGEKRMVTFRQLEILFGFNYGEGTQWKFKESELQSVWATIAEGEYSSSRSKAAQIRSPVLRYVHKALANTFFARKATGTINEGELKLLDMGIRPLIKRTKDGRYMCGDSSNTGNLIPFLDQLASYKVTAFNARFQKGRKLSVGGLITPILCAAGVDTSNAKSTGPGWMNLKFCKTNNLIDHKEVNRKFQFLFKHPIAGPSKMLLPRTEFTTVKRGNNIDFSPPLFTLVGHEDEVQGEEAELDRAESRAGTRPEGRAEDRAGTSVEEEVPNDETLGEPECYYFQEYEAPRMAPSVEAAHKRIGLLQKLNKWQGKAMKKMQDSMDKMVSTIKKLEKKVTKSSSKKVKATPTSKFMRSRSLLTTPRRPSAQDPPRASSYEPREEGSSRRKSRKSSRARRSNSTDGLDRVDTNPELDRAEGRVEEEGADFENPGFEHDPAPSHDPHQSNWTPYSQFERAKFTQGQGSHTYFDDIDETCVEIVPWSAPDGRLPSPPADIASQFFGEH